MINVKKQIKSIKKKTKTKEKLWYANNHDEEQCE